MKVAIRQKSTVSKLVLAEGCVWKCSVADTTSRAKGSQKQRARRILLVSPAESSSSASIFP